MGRLRAVAGDQVLLFVGARGIVRDEAGRLLLIRRADNGYWALPAGAMEVGESIAECAAREVYEETGLTVREATPFALYSGAAHIRTDMFGNTYQLHVTVFRVDEWSGELRRETDETTDAGFFPLDALPEPLAASIPGTLDDLATFEHTGRLILA
ncbi:MAG TPA: NUDIX domain-containing protein [Rugosimonospora sp.]|nr:NUDIX domain-containing protein [Rugosimonospora sp.]